MLALVNLQWTLSISTTLYLELLSISNKKLGPLDICVLSKLFLSLSPTSLSRIFFYLEQKSWSLATISLSISNFFPSKGPVWAYLLLIFRTIGFYQFFSDSLLLNYQPAKSGKEDKARRFISVKNCIERIERK